MEGNQICESELVRARVHSRLPLEWYFEALSLGFDSKYKLWFPLQIPKKNLEGSREDLSGTCFKLKK